MTSIEISKDFKLNVLSPDRGAIENLRYSKSFSCDIETTGLVSKLNKIRLIQVYLPTLKNVYVLDLWHPKIYDQEFLEVLLTRLIDRDCTKIWHNSLFDVEWFFYHYGVLSLNNFDTMIASQIDKAGKFFGYQKTFFNSPNSLAFLCEEHGLAHDKVISHEVWKNPKPLEWVSIVYAARDAYFTFVLAKVYKVKLSYCWNMVMAEMGSIPCFVQMNHQGLPANKNAIEERYQAYLQKADELEKLICSTIKLDPLASLTWYNEYYAVKGLPKKLNTEEKLLRECQKREFSPSSYQSVAKWLCSIVDVERLKKTDNKTGKTTISTDKMTLFVLATDLGLPELSLLIYYRSISGAASKFNSYLKSYDEENQSILGSYTVLARQGSGRSSSGKSAAKGELKFHNCQNFSKYLDSHAKYQLPSTRSLVQAREGYVLAEFDAPASHLTIATHLTQDKSLLESKKSGLKVHYYTLAGILSKIESRAVTPLEARNLVEDKTASPEVKARYQNLYRLSKTVIYAFLNGAGAATLQATFFKLETMVTLEDCATYLEACKSQYSGLANYQRKVFDQAKSTLKPYYVSGKYIGHFAHGKHLDGAVTYYQGRIKETPAEKFIEKDLQDEDLFYDASEDYLPVTTTKSKAEIYLKLGDVVSSKWLRPEATIMKKALAKAHDYQLSSRLNFRIINFSHDSFLAEIHESCLEEVGRHLYECVNSSFLEYIPDFEPEFKGANGWKESVLGSKWK